MINGCSIGAKSTGEIVLANARGSNADEAMSVRTVEVTFSVESGLDGIGIGERPTEYHDE